MSPRQSALIHLSLRRLVTVAALMFAWCALWGGPSAANLLSGFVVGVVVSVAGVGTAGRGRIRILPLVRFAGLVAKDLIFSTVAVAAEVLTPVDYTDEAIIEVKLPAQSRNHLLLLTVAVTVTPGTAVVDADPETATLYLHLLHADRAEATTLHVQELANLACQSLPVAATTVGAQP